MHELARADLSPLPPAEAIYAIGDSQVVGFDSRAFAFGDRTFVFRSVFGRLKAQNWAGSAESLSAKVLDLLARAGVSVAVDGPPQALHATDNPVLRALYGLEGRPPAVPPIVISNGLMDCIYVSTDLAGVPDVALPEGLVEASGPLAGTPLAGAMPFADALGVARDRMAPFARGLRGLQEHRYTRLALLSVPPPTPDDGEHRAELATFGVAYPPMHETLRWRTILRLLMNATLASIAAETGVTFVDRWNDQTVGGEAKPGVLAGSSRLSDAANDATVRAVLREFVLAGGVPDSGARYQVIVDDPSAATGVSGHTVDAAGFAALTRADAGETFSRVVDVNTGTTAWIHRSRIVQIGRI